MLSMHTSPLAQPGAGDSGGMNVYVRELASLAGPGRRRRSTCSPGAGDDRPARGRRRRARPAGRPRPRRSRRPRQGGPARGRRRVHRRRARAHPQDGDVDALHANYWLSGVAGHRLKHELELPLVSTFHTLARVKAETGDPEPQRRIDAEAEVIACSDAITASCPAEADDLVAHYGADPARIELVPPGVVHAFFSPGDQARRPRRPRARRRPAGAAVRRPHPAAQGPRRRRRARSPRSSRTGPTPCSSSSAGRAAPTATPRSPGCASWSTSSALDDRVRFVDAAAPPPPLDLLPGRRRRRRAQPLGVLRARRPRGGGLRHARGRRRGRRPAHARRPRPHRVPRRRPRPRRLRRGHRARSSPTRRWPRRLSARRRDRWPPATRWSTTAARLRRLYADLTARALVDCRGDLSTGDTPRALDGGRARRVEARIDAWARRQLDELDVVDAVERGEAERAAVVHPGAGRGQGRLHHLAHAAPADAAITRPT